MPVAVIQEWVEPETEHSTASYDRISERLGARDDPPRGLLMHSAGHTGTGFRIFEVWETQSDFDVFMVDGSCRCCWRRRDRSTRPRT